MPVPVVYRKTSVSPEYTFKDLATGQAYLRLYGGDYYSGANAYVMSTEQFYAHSGVSVDGGGTNNINFDILLKKSITIEGHAILNVPILLCADNTGPYTITTTADLSLWVSGAALTLIASGAAIHTDTISANQGKQRLIALKLAVPKTVIKSGEYFRLKLLTPDADTGGSRRQIGFCHDPYNRTSISLPDFSVTYSVPTWTIIDLPIKISE